MRNRCHKQAFSLAEVTVAIGISSFVLLALLALLPTGLRTAESSINASEAANLVVGIGRDLRAGTVLDESDPPMPRSRLYGITLPPPGGVEVTELFLGQGGARLEGGAAGQARYRVRARVSRGNAALDPYVASIQVFWPAQAEIEYTQGLFETVTIVQP